MSFSCTNVRFVLEYSSDLLVELQVAVLSCHSCGPQSRSSLVSLVVVQVESILSVVPRVLLVGSVLNV
eukprot:4215111-Amphidinium_carterae.1